MLLSFSLASIFRAVLEHGEDLVCLDLPNEHDAHCI